ncbi:hypothetical protein DL96DRAFT_1713676 [Flagelloscypha sp. PMI_526]|nr:hypothetical protein DL96DRAFT_1713676 [Flagelloscypha sp. PMI_526]
MSKRLELPFDVLQLLVEFSASSSTPGACVLSLVSHECQSWSDIHLFRFLVEPASAMKDSMSNLLDNMCSDNASPRLIRARKHVRSLSWFEHPQSRLILHNLGPYLFLLPNLVQLCVWENYIPELANDAFKFPLEKPHPSLRKVFTRSFTSESLPSAGFSYAFWSMITHLQLESDHSLDSNESPFAKPILATMDQLTHLAIGQPTNIDENEQHNVDIDIIISRVQAAFPPHLILCLLSIEPGLVVDRTQNQITSLRLGHTDERIVLWAMPHLEDEYVVLGASHSLTTFEVWSGLPDGKETFWEAGISIQKERKRVTK